VKKSGGVHLGALRVLEADPAFAGAWYDPSRDGRLTIAVVGPVTREASTRALSLLDEAFHPAVRDVELTLADLAALLGEVETAVAADDSSAEHLWGTRVDVQRNAVVLTVKTFAPADAEVQLRETYGRPGVEVVRDTAPLGVLYGSELGTLEPGSTDCRRCGGTHPPLPPGRTCTWWVAGSAG